MKLYGSTSRVYGSSSPSFRYSISTTCWVSIAFWNVLISFFLRSGVRLGCLCEIELAERLLELSAHAVERGVRVGSDRRSDELESEPDRPSLERSQPRRLAERVTPDLLVDPDLVAVELRIHRVTAAAEIDEIEKRKVLLELVLGNVEPLDELCAPG